MTNRIKKKLAFFTVTCLLFHLFFTGNLQAKASEAAYIRWVDLSITKTALRDTIKADIEAHDTDHRISYIDLLAALGQKYGGDFKQYKKQDLETFLQKGASSPLVEVVNNPKLYRYYQEAYTAALGGLVGTYIEEIKDESGNVTQVKKYGLKCYHPLAAGYSYSHSDDFGNARSYGYKRRHLGHDMFGDIGTPVIAIESGYIEALGWNQYGGWRIGIRSFDGMRYYYYAHLRKDHPYAADMYEGKIVSAGEVIGYLGMTGYSAKENKNNIKVPHLHVGMQIIFDKSQKDGVNQIWVDLYALINYLEDNRVRTYRAGGESVSRIRIIDENMPD